MRTLHRQAGAALLAAMLTVTLVATFAAAALWQQWRSVEIEAAERARVQSGWILTGALDWARLILSEDGRGTERVDHLGEPWAIPLQEARLSTFLAADRSNTVDTQAEEVFLSGQIIDLQSMLNAGNLFDASGVNLAALLRFQRLFELLGLPQAELNRMAENMRFASDISTDNLSAREAPLQPQKLEQLAWVGLSPQTISVLQPYVTVLPEVTVSGGLNLNTAPAEVLYAAIPGISLADAQRLVAERGRVHFRNREDVRKLLALDTDPDPLVQTGVSSNFFEVRGRLRMGQVVVEERSVVKRDGTRVQTRMRERGVVDPTALARAATGQR